MTLVSWRETAPWNSNGKIESGGAEYERGMKKRPFSHCRYCIPIHQAAQLSRADPRLSRAFLYEVNVLFYTSQLSGTGLYSLEREMDIGTISCIHHSVALLQGRWWKSMGNTGFWAFLAP